MNLMMIYYLIKYWKEALSLAKIINHLDNGFNIKVIIFFSLYLLFLNHKYKLII